MSIGLTEIVLVLIVVLVLFGSKRLPELARAFGKAQHEYKKAKDLLQNEARELTETVEKPISRKKKKTREKK